MDLAIRQTVGSFEGSSNFLLDPARGQWFSLATGNGTTTLNVYDLNSLQRVHSVQIAGISADTASLVRFGQDGVAFRTTGTTEPSRIVLVQIRRRIGDHAEGVLDNYRDVDIAGVRAVLVRDVQNGSLALGCDGSSAIVHGPSLGH